MGALQTPRAAPISARPSARRLARDPSGPLRPARDKWRAYRRSKRSTTACAVVIGTRALLKRWTSQRLAGKTAEAAAWPWRVALETLGHDAAAAPPHTLAKLIEGEKLPWVVARVEKALRREDDAADAVFVLGDDSGATMVAQFSTRAAAQAGGEVRAGSVVAVRRPATLRGAGDDACLVVDAPDLVVAVPPAARARGAARRAAGAGDAAASGPGPGPGPGPAATPPSPPRPAERTRPRPAAAAPAAAPRRASTTETGGDDLVDALLDGGRLLTQQDAPPRPLAPDGGGDDVDALLDSFGC